MNLGGEIDDLVMPGEPGYFLWGGEVPESEYSSVRRKTMNTIKLDPHQDGASGKTGVGRAFAFGRANELKDALRDTGSKNGNTPRTSSSRIHSQAVVEAAWSCPSCNCYGACLIPMR